MNSELF